MPKKQTGLGRGFDSLIPTNLVSENFADDSGVSNDQDHAHLLIQDITPNPDQPRKDFSKQALGDLANSIKLHGVIQPILVIKKGDKQFVIVAGERRWRAAQQAGLTKIPAVVKGLDKKQQLELALIENIQREDLSPLEMAQAFVQLEKNHKLSAKQIGERVGKARSTVANTKRLLQLPNAAKQALASLRINEQHARAILALEGNEKKQQELLDLILRNNWSGARAEQFVQAHKDGANSITEAISKMATSNPETIKISKKLDTDVRHRPMAKGGRIIISYKDKTDYNRITKLLT